MSDATLLSLAFAASACIFSSALVFFALKVQGMIHITVQAPTAIIPEHVERILSEVNEKLHPERPKLSPEEQEAAIADIVREARLVAEQMEANNRKLGHEVTGAEKQREAVRYITKRLEPLNIDLNYNAIALRLEAEVAGAKKEQESHA